MLEATLLNIRKLNEFLKAPGRSEGPDDLWAYQYPGFSDVGAFLTDQNHREIHKRIGHMTVRAVRHGNVLWLIHDAMTATAKKSLKFLNYLITDFYGDNVISGALPIAAKGALGRMLRDTEFARQREEAAV